MRKAKIDHYGRAWLTITMPDDIKVVLRFTFRNEGLGATIYAEDFDISAHMWFDGETFYSTSTTIFNYREFPS